MSRLLCQALQGFDMTHYLIAILSNLGGLVQRLFTQFMYGCIMTLQVYSLVRFDNQY